MIKCYYTFSKSIKTADEIESGDIETIEPAHKLKFLAFKINILTFYTLKCLHIV